MSNWILKAELKTRNAIENFVKGEEAPAALEYGIMVALIAAVIIGTVALIGTELGTAFETVLDELTGTGT